MSTPVLETIAQALADTVAQIESLTVLRPKRAYFWDEVTADLTVVIQQDAPSKGEHTYYTQDWLQPFELLCLAQDSDQATASIDTRLNQLRADIEKKLLADDTLGGLAVGLTLEPPTYVSAGPLTALVMRVIVHYRTAYHDPYINALTGE